MPHSTLHQALADDNDQALTFGALGAGRVGVVTGAACVALSLQPVPCPAQRWQLRAPGRALD